MMDAIYTLYEYFTVTFFDGTYELCELYSSTYKHFSMLHKNKNTQVKEQL